MPQPPYSPSPPSSIVPVTITQVTQSGSEAGSLPPQEEHREAVVLSQDHSPAICDFETPVTGMPRHKPPKIFKYEVLRYLRLFSIMGVSLGL